MSGGRGSATATLRGGVARTVLACATALAVILGAPFPASATPSGEVTLYVTDFLTGGGVYAMSPRGGELRTVMRSDESHRPIGIEIVGATAYVTERHDDYFSKGRLVAVPLAGGEPTTVAELSTPGFVTAIGDTLYAVDSGLADNSAPRIVAVPIGGGAPRVVAQGGVQGPAGITSIGSTLYFVDLDVRTNTGRVLSMPASGGTPQVLATLTGPFGITAVGTQLYVTRFDPGAATSKIVSLAIAGGEPELIAEGPAPLMGIAASDNSLYTAGHVETTGDTRGEVASALLTGGEMTTITTALTYPIDVATVVGTPPCSGSVCGNVGNLFSSS